MQLAGLILAGGRSSRMGRDKAALMWHGESLLRRQARILTEAGIDDIFLSLAPGASDPDPELGLPIVRDRVEGGGPLEGIVAGLERVAPSDLLVLAVDMPRVDVALLEGLISIGGSEGCVAPRVEERWEPLCAIYAAEVLTDARRSLAEGRRSPTTLLDRLHSEGRARALDLPSARASALVSWNRPEDLPGTSPG